jgi:hypothetical protein
VDGNANKPDVRIDFAGAANLVLLTGTGLVVRASTRGAVHAFGAWAYKCRERAFARPVYRGRA